MYMSLFWVFLKVGFLTVGGGAAAIPFIEHECVEKRKWINNEELMDAISISNILPGPSMVEMAGYIGYKQKGKRGSIIASVAIGIPVPSIFLLLYATVFSQLDVGLLTIISEFALPVIAAMMISLVINIFRQSYHSVGLIWFSLIGIASLVLYGYFDIFPPFIFIGGLFVNYSFLKWGDR